MAEKGGNKVFDRMKDAVTSCGSYRRTRKSQIPDATLQESIDSLMWSQRRSPETEIADAAAAGGDARKLAAAARELSKAADELAKGHAAAASSASKTPGSTPRRLL